MGYLHHRILVAIPLLVMGAAGLVSSACSGEAEGGGRIEVLTTIAPVAALVRAVAGDMAVVRVLVEPGVDPHDFELSPRDYRALDDADIVVRIGLGIDRFADGAEGKRMLTLSDGLPLREFGGEGEEAHSGDDGHDHEDGGFDPHVWHDPENDKVMADAIAARLADVDPADAATYQANAEAFKKRLDEADTAIRALIAEIPEENRKIVSNHDSIGYFLDRYGLEFVGAVIPSLTTSAEPSAGQIADLIDTIEREGVKAIFAESSVDPKVARQVADDTGVAIVDDLYGDSLGAPGSGADTIEGMLVANAEKIAAALK